MKRARRAGWRPALTVPLILVSSLLTAFTSTHDEVAVTAEPGTVATAEYATRTAPGEFSLSLDVDGSLSAQSTRTARRSWSPTVFLPVLSQAFAWRPVRAAIPDVHWSPTADLPHVAGLHGIGFPSIVRGSTVIRSGRWQPMIAWREAVAEDEPGTAQPIASVRCMGHSPRFIAARADLYDPLILELALEHGLSASLVKAVVTEESCFDPAARSKVGAIGLMQLMPETAAWLRVADPTDPEQNLRAGVRYLATLVDEFGGLELPLAAYNAGPGTVRRLGRMPAFSETVAYVGRVLSNYRRYVAAARIGARTRPRLASAR